MARSYDAIVVGAGPNGLAAAITLAEAGWRVLLLERNATVGGAVRSASITAPSFVHDLGAAILPFGVGSPFLRRMPLDRHGLRWIHPDAPLAHPLDGAPAALLERDMDATSRGLGADGRAWKRVFGPVVADWPMLEDEVLGPLLRHPLALARFGLRALSPASLLARAAFRTAQAQALFAGLAAHSGLSLRTPGSSAIAVVLGVLAHRVGWPFPKGGAQALSDALAAHFTALGGEIRTGEEIGDLSALPAARAVLLDVSPRALDRIAGNRLPSSYRRALGRFRHGPGAYKVDYALNGPIPWTDPAVARAATVHLGGTLAEITAAEADVAAGRPATRPFVLLAQHTIFDPTRAPEGGHTVWAYAHVPNGYTGDYAAVIEAQIERFAPGFGARVRARHVTTPAALEQMDPNLVGGDVNGGAADLPQTIARPVLRPMPYRTPLAGVYLCSASTPPGGGVHGLCGHRAARAALRDAGAA